MTDWRWVGLARSTSTCRIPQCVVGRQLFVAGLHDFAGCDTTFLRYDPDAIHADQGAIFRFAGCFGRLLA